MVVLAFITDPKVLERILGHLGLPTTPPTIAPARLPVEIDLPLDEMDEGLLDDGCLDEAPTTTLRTRLPRSPPAPL